MPLFPPPVPSPWILGSEIALSAGSGNAVLVANTVYLWAVEINAQTTITAMRWRLAATATGNADAGVYDSAGNLLGHTGSTANSANVDVTANLIASITVSAGKYYLALSPGNSTDTYGRATSLIFGTPVIDRAFTAANNSTGTTSPVLPATTGAVTGSNLMPTVVGVVQGGIA